jgi:hypothetical protein
MNIKEYATYTIPATDGKPIEGKLNNLRARKFTPAIVQRKVAKAFNVNPGHVTNIKIHAV